MSKVIVINGKEYSLDRKVTFEDMCRLEELEVSFDVDERNLKMFTMVRGLTALVIGCSPEQAAIEITEHVEKGGKLQDLEPISKWLYESDFFKKGVLGTKKK